MVLGDYYFRRRFTVPGIDPAGVVGIKVTFAAVKKNVLVFTGGQGQTEGVEPGGVFL